MPWRKEKKIGKSIGVSAERLRYWESKGIITLAYERHGPKGLRRYSGEDIAIASEIKKMVDSDVFSFKGAAERSNRIYLGG